MTYNCDGGHCFKETNGYGDDKALDSRYDVDECRNDDDDYVDDDNRHNDDDSDENFEEIWIHQQGNTPP